MKITNFELVERTGQTALNWRFKALVDVTRGIIFKKTTREYICKEYAGFWYFCDTGKFTPGTEAEDACRVYMAINGPITTAEIR